MDCWEGEIGEVVDYWYVFVVIDIVFYCVVVVFGVEYWFGCVGFGWLVGYGGYVGVFDFVWYYGECVVVFGDLLVGYCFDVGWCGCY